MRTLSVLAVVLAVALASCTDSPTSTTTTKLGKITIEEIQANTGYAWYQTGYDAFPDASRKAEFDQQVAMLKANLDTSTQSVVMVIKPTCSCQKTQLYLPQAMKTLDEAGFPHDRISIYVTDARMSGIDSIKTALQINAAPTFVVLKNGVEKGRIVEDPTFGLTMEQELTSFFAKP